MEKGWKKRLVSLMLVVVLVVGSLLIDGVKAQAAMVDVAMDFSIGDTLRGSFNERGRIYYRFTLNSRQRIVIKGMSPESSLRRSDSSNYSDDIRIYNAEGEKILDVDGYGKTYWTYNAATDLYSLNLPVTLNKGTYYLGIYRWYQGSEYAFTTEYAPSTKYPVMQLSITLNTGNSLQLGTIISPDAAKSKLKWSTSDKNTVSVSSKGKIKAKKQGEATITASCNGSKIKIQVIVK